MNKIELKQVLKPLIKQCIKEVIFEEGVLSNIITEVVKGIQPLNSNITQQAVQLEQKQSTIHNKKEKERVILEERWEQDRERRRKLLEATGFDNSAPNIFEGVEPLSGNQAGVTSAGQPAAASPTSPLAAYAPNDPGVNIAGIESIGGTTWKRMLNEVKG